MKKDCDTCYHNTRECNAMLLNECQQTDRGKWEPYTRGDYIRQMSDIELENLLCAIIGKDGNCHNCIARGQCSPGHNGFKYWLKERVEAE